MAIQPVGPPPVPNGAFTIALPLPSTTAPESAAAAKDVTGKSAAQPAQQVAATSPDAQNSRVDRQEIDHALDEVRKVVAPLARNLQFSVDDDTGHTVVKVVDSSTNEVIRQIPSEEILSIAKALDKLKGLLIKQEA